MESVLELADFVSDAVVVKRFGRLRAYYTIQAQARSLPAHRKFLVELCAQHLPPDFQPSTLSRVGQLPVRGGKVNRAKMASPGWGRKSRQARQGRAPHMNAPENAWNFEGALLEAPGETIVIGHRLNTPSAPLRKILVSLRIVRGKKPLRMKVGDFLRLAGEFGPDGALVALSIERYEPKYKIPLGNAQRVLEAL